MKYKVLIVDDEPLIRMSLESGLFDLGYEPRSAADIQEGLALAEQFSPDAVLLDNRLGGELGVEHVGDFKRIDEDMMVILMTAYGSVSQAVEAMKLGVSDYVQKPFDLEEVDLIISRGMEQLTRRRSLELMRLRPHKMLGCSQAIAQIRENIRILAENDNVDLLICGETGTGKEVVVNSIHNGSSRRDKPMVKINCGAIPSNLLESELFGYEKGAFTGAAKAKKGLMELANGGTVFLDEIGELPLFMQAKLLTFLEDRSFKRVGGLRDIEVNVRVAAATNRDLEAEVRKGTFREDLYYRLNVLVINVPPLRERVEDIRPLAQHFVQTFNKKYGVTKHLSPETIRIMEHYSWPGNVRELRNTMERMMVESKNNLIDPKAFRKGDTVVVERASHPIADNTLPYQQAMEACERKYISDVVDACGGNIRQAAEKMGLHISTLYRKIDKLGLSFSKDGADGAGFSPQAPNT